MSKVLILLTIFLSQAIQAQISNPAVVSGIGELSGSVGYVTHSGSSVINASVGRWDTPYTSDGDEEPGQEPDGNSVLYIDIAVNDGGLASFRFSISSYDVGRYLPH